MEPLKALVALIDRLLLDHTDNKYSELKWEALVDSPELLAAREAAGMPKKDYDKHIAHPTEKNRARCGAVLGCFDWKFIDDEHARLTVEQGQWLVPCPACLAAAYHQNAEAAMKFVNSNAAGNRTGNTLKDAYKSLADVPADCSVVEVHKTHSEAMFLS